MEMWGFVRGIVVGLSHCGSPAFLMAAVIRQPYINHEIFPRISPAVISFIFIIANHCLPKSLSEAPT